MKKLTIFIAWAMLVGATAIAQEITSGVPIHARNYWDSQLPLQTWECSATQIGLSNMLEFRDTNGTVNGYVDCHGVIHGGGGGTPGAPNLSIQGNNGGVFAGIPGSVIDFTNGLVTLTPPGNGFALTVNGDSNNHSPILAISNSGAPLGVASFDTNGLNGVEGIYDEFQETDDIGSGTIAYGLLLLGIFPGLNNTGDSFSDIYISSPIEPNPSSQMAGISIADKNVLSVPASLLNAAIIINNQTPGANVFSLKSGTGPASFGDILSPGILTLTTGTSEIAAYGGDGWSFGCSDCDTPTVQGATCTAAGDHAGAYAIAIEGGLACFGLNIGSGSGVTLQTLEVNNASQGLLDFDASSVDAVGLHITFSNPSGGKEVAEITGAYTGTYSGNAATATAFAAVPTGCTGTEFMQSTDASGNATCATPSGGGGSPTLQVAGSDNASQVLLNDVASSTDALGIRLTPTNPSGGIVKYEATGTTGETANEFLATPNGSTGALALRAIVAADLPAALANSTSINGTAIPASATLERVYNSGSKTLSTAALAPGQCNLDTVTVAGATTSMRATASTNQDLTTVTGFVSSSNGVLTIYPPYVTAGQWNIKTCNNTNINPLTPGAVTILWTVLTP